MEVELRNLAKAYGSHRAVDDLSVGLLKGEMVALLGPSGCGKTTTLRMVAGFVEPTAGQILFQGRDVTRLPPHKRDTGLVFQSYALFPHLSVSENIAFGLRRRGVGTPERAARIGAMVEKLKLGGLEDRLPRQLSGGQQQRVAVARALVINPAVLLLDEPFSNLDAKLRESTGIELRRIQRELGLTSIFVTHDQHEAMSIADKIAVMNGGRIEQLGTATEIYERPRTRFIADFIGSANFLAAEVESVESNLLRLRYGGGFVATTGADRRGMEVGHQVQIMIRPERVKLVAGQTSEQDDEARITIETISYQGSFANVIARLPNGETLIVQTPGHEAGRIEVGAAASIRLDARDIVVFPHDDGCRA